MSTADGLPQHTRAFSLHCDHYFLKVIYFYIIQKDKQITVHSSKAASNRRTAARIGASRSDNSHPNRCTRQQLVDALHAGRLRRRRT
jgi:hypothetical protein